MSRLLRANIWAVAIVAVALAVTLFIANPGPPREVTLATGAAGGAYDAFGRALATRLTRDGLTVKLQATQGSVENLALLRADDNDVSIALVQSGIARESDAPELRSLGALFHEPLWVFTRRDFNLSSLRDLRGRRVAIGPEGSGSRPVAQQVIEITGIADAVTTEPLGGEAAYEALRGGTIDVAMFIASPQSPFIRKLLFDAELKFHGLQRIPAYAAALPRLTTIDVGEGQLDLPRNIPPAECTLLSAVVTLVVNDRFYSGLAPLILEAAKDVLREGGSLERPGDFPAPRPTDFPLLREADHYHENGVPFLLRVLPFWPATMLVRFALLLVPLIVLLIPLFRIAPPIYQWQTRRKIYRWYSYLREIDQHLRTGATRETIAADLQGLRDLQHEILSVKVPLSHTDELYNLHLHIDWVIRRLQDEQSAAQTENG
jgi:uncharacterized protein